MLCPDPPDLDPLKQTLLDFLIGAGTLVAVQFIFRRTVAFISHFVWSRLAALASKPVLAGALLLLTVICVRVALLHRFPVPIPGIHDESSYLLMADTFAHGRLSSPPHPMWISLESFHVNWFPRYASMYPPAQGLILALGQLLGSPWIGVLLSSATMVAAIYWMLLAWVPPRWAFVGGIIAWLKLCVTSYWINSYWGGAVAAAGGALFLGGFIRIVGKSNTHQPKTLGAILLALGLAILANSRPYEGFLFSLPAGVYLVVWLFRRASSPMDVLRRRKAVALPILAVLALTAATMAFYNCNLTGHALLFPESLNVRTYHTAPMFLFQSAKPQLHYHNQQFEDFYNDWEREEYDHTWGSFWCLTWLKTVRLFSAFSWWGMLLAAPGLYFGLRSHRMRLLWIALALVLLGAFVIVWSNSHYVAPATSVVVLLYVQALRYLRLPGRQNWHWGSILARSSILLLLADTTLAVTRKQCDNFYWTCQGDVSRFVILHKLEALPGKHLVMVRYGEDHNIHDDWVYNGADIDSQRVVWAREIDEGQDAKLFDYYRDRKVWLVTPDSDNTYLAPYTPPEDRK
jgi:hypothetical protein